MAKTMAEVLAEHSAWQYQGNLGYYRSEYICQCGGTFWYGDHEEDPSFNEALAAHQSAALSVAGYGLVADAKWAAWDEAVNEADPPRQWQIGHASAAILKQDNPYRKASNDEQ